MTFTMMYKQLLPYATNKALVPTASKEEDKSAAGTPSNLAILVAKSQEVYSLIALGAGLDWMQELLEIEDQSAYGAWTFLCGKFEKSSRANRIQLRKKFNGLSHNPGEPISTYISAALSLRTALKAIGVIVDDIALGDLIIGNLHHSYGNVASNLSILSEEPSIATITSALENEELRRKDVDEEAGTILVARGPSGSRPSASSTCNICKSPDHWSRDCTNRCKHCADKGKSNNHSEKRCFDLHPELRNRNGDRPMESINVAAAWNQGEEYAYLSETLGEGQDTLFPSPVTGNGTALLCPGSSSPFNDTVRQLRSAAVKGHRSAVKGRPGHRAIGHRRFLFVYQCLPKLEPTLTPSKGPPFTACNVLVLTAGLLKLWGLERSQLNKRRLKEPTESSRKVAIAAFACSYGTPTDAVLTCSFLHSLVAIVARFALKYGDLAEVAAAQSAFVYLFCLLFCYHHLLAKLYRQAIRKHVFGSRRGNTGSRRPHSVCRPYVCIRCTCACAVLRPSYSIKGQQAMRRRIEVCDQSCPRTKLTD